MNFERLATVISWLAKRKWGLSFLLAVVSFVSLIAVAVRQPAHQLDYYIQGPAFRAGVYVGALFSRDDATRDLFGAAGDIFFLMGFWFIVIWVVHWVRARRQNSTPLNR